MIAGWQITAAIALGAAVAAFGAGWQIRAWKCESALLAQQEAAQKAFNEQLAHQHDESTVYEGERNDGQQRERTAATEIRTIYRDRIVSPDCALASRGVLQREIDAANARIAGQPGSAVPSDPPAASDEP